MERPLALAVVGATGLVGEALLEMLAESDLPLAEVHAVAAEESVGKRVSFGATYLKVASLEQFDFTSVEVALFAVPPAVSARYSREAASAGCLALDLSGVWLADPTVPVWCAGVSGLDSETWRESRLLSVLTGAPAVVAQALVALEALGPRGANVTSLMPASAAGRAAVEELARQTARLLNSQTSEPAVFPTQSAFSAIAAGPSAIGSGSLAPAQSLLAALHRLNLLPGAGVGSLAAWVPAFFGQSLALSIQCEASVSEPVARQLLEDAGFEVVPEDAARQGTSLTEDLPARRARIATVSAAAADEGMLACWIGFDNVRYGAALKGVQIVELLLKDYL